MSRVTFRGIIKALADVKEELKNQHIKIFVRRGGPHQEAGLAQLRTFMEKEGLEGQVNGPELILTDIVAKAIQTQDIISKKEDNFVPNS